MLVHVRCFIYKLCSFREISSKVTISKISISRKETWKADISSELHNMQTSCRLVPKCYWCNSNDTNIAGTATCVVTKRKVKYQYFLTSKLMTYYADWHPAAPPVNRLAVQITSGIDSLSLLSAPWARVRLPLSLSTATWTPNFWPLCRSGSAKSLQWKWPIFTYFV